MAAFLDADHAVNYYGHAVVVETEPVAGHVLRMGSDLTSATSFAPHQDDADHKLATITSISKLTCDRPGEPCSQFHICGAESAYEYGPEQGATALFLANAYHQSMVPLSPCHHIKLALFWQINVVSETGRRMRKTRAST